MSHKAWTQFLLLLQKKQPFFATLAMYCEFSLCDDIEFAKTEDKKVTINPMVYQDMTQQQRFVFLLHQVLHLALQHPLRGKDRELEVWNVAADIAVNCIIHDSLKLPAAPFTAWDHRYRDYSAEEIYHDLIKAVDSERYESDCTDENEASEQGEQCDQSQVNQQHANQDQGSSSKTLAQYQARADIGQSGQVPQSCNHTKAYWDKALTSAKLNNELSNQWSHQSTMLLREVDIALSNRVDWKTQLWRYVQLKMSDFSEFDNRFIHRGIYNETIYTLGLDIAVGIDTSGSISNHQLGVFLSELNAIAHAQPHISIALYFADADIDGPYMLTKSNFDIPPIRGGGGTSFVPFFEQIKCDFPTNSLDALIYFTDGDGDYPNDPPDTDTLWLITKPENIAPFGQTLSISI